MNNKHSIFVGRRASASRLGANGPCLYSSSSSFQPGACAMRPRLTSARAAVIGLALMSAASINHAFTSGSTGADGDLAPSVDTVINLPPSGILNYASITIPANVKVTFKKNVTNTPVVLLVAGNATISGTLDVSGTAAANSGTAGDGVLADDGNPGAGGPGGFGGGRGGRPGGVNSPDRLGGKGLGPGGGNGGLRNICGTTDYDLNQGYLGYGGGGGASYGTLGAAGGSVCGGDNPSGKAGLSYGAAELLPLIGGSGGGGGVAGSNWAGSGGGGGGGALLIAASGTITITNTTGKILALGGAGGNVAPAGCQGTPDRSSAGGGGSGGAIRLVATTIAGNGQISADNGARGTSSCAYEGGTGGDGRIRLEAETITRTAGSTPTHSFGQPGPVFIAGSPTLSITTVAGVNVPQPPTGVADVRLPATTANPVTVGFATTNIPVGNTVKLSVVPASGAEVTAVSTALTGSTAAATASAAIELPAGASTLQASITYTVVVAVGEALSRYAQGERVERVTVTAGLDGKSSTTLITVSGREFAAPPEALHIAAWGG
ncbi:hypothetical protein [Paucibacter sp. XJ19-41]|uniref:hypothetical protein n=1 Tax=Paucibacter sp. XJ19-41 TaxID=2927824 RepID=UPI002349B10E|nr:hypothetical protein [Paucibacter sp. XJ19-41]MDC6170011.1 hypothetical protein [Paucibacter sp. XJ19-41]